MPRVLGFLTFVRVLRLCSLLLLRIWENEITDLSICGLKCKFGLRGLCLSRMIRIRRECGLLSLSDLSALVLTSQDEGKRPAA